MKTLIIVPARDEQDTIGDVLEDLKKHGWNDILVVDDQSQDLTPSVVEQKKVKLISLPVHLGAWGAIQTGMYYALKQDYDLIVTVDADNQHEVRYVKDLVKEIAQSDVDMVIGAYPQRITWLKKVLLFLVKKLSGLNFTDPTIGFRAYKRHVLNKFLDDNGLILEYQDVGVLLLAKQHQLKIKEIPVKMQPRTFGKSRIFSNGLVILKYTFFTLTYSLFFSQRRIFSSLNKENSDFYKMYRT